MSSSGFPATAPAPSSPSFTGAATPSSATTPTAYSSLSVSQAGSLDTTNSSNMTAVTTGPNGEIGEQRANGAESSKMAVEAVSAEVSSHAQGMAEYLWQAGYLQGQWTDVQLAFFDQTINLHRIVLSRSPYLAEILRPYPPGSVINLSFPDPIITAPSIHICIQHLYNPSTHLIDPSNAQAILATSFHLGGMPEMCSKAYTTIRDSLSSGNILETIDWLGPETRAGPTSQPGPVRGGSPAMFGGLEVQNGLASPASSSPPTSERHGPASGAGVAQSMTVEKYGEWSRRLKDDVNHFLIQTLPSSSSLTDLTTSSSSSFEPTVLTIYTQLPYELFKSCIESPDLPITSTQSRFTFAKKVIAQRKKRPMAKSEQMEEGVVLAVGNKQGSVQVIRKPKKGKTALYKAGVVG